MALMLEGTFDTPDQMDAAAVALMTKHRTETVNVIDQAHGENWQMYHSDCVAMLAGLPDDSVHFSMFSPPFISLYTFSDDPRDVSNNRTDRVFWDHYKWVLSGIFRALKPGRKVAIHCMDLPTSITRDGFIGMKDFPAGNRELCEEIGFIFHARVLIRKDPVTAMQRTKAIGLLHKQIVKDSSLSRMGINDQIIVMRKPGDNPEPVDGLLETYYGDDMTDEEMTNHAKRSFTGQDISDDFAIEIAKEWGIIEVGMPISAVIAAVRKEIANANKTRTFEEHKSIQIWQRYADVWMDIRQNNVLSNKLARAEHDERHISPLQLTPIRRCLDLWTNPGDVVLSPFTGIGSVGYCAIEMDRKFLGAELKSSYYRQACANLREAERKKNDGTLFDERELIEEIKEGIFGDA